MAIPFNRGGLRSIGWMSSVREPPSSQTETSVTKIMKAAGMERLAAKSLTGNRRWTPRC